MMMTITYNCHEQEAIAVGRSFASIKGYHLDGNKEMVAMGFMNVIGSITSCYTATGQIYYLRLFHIICRFKDFFFGHFEFSMKL